MKDFWLSCGHHLLDRGEGGGLLVTDEFLKVYLARPELAPPPEACAAERALHHLLLDHPRRMVAADEELIAGKSGAPVSPLVSMLGLPGPDEIDVLNEDNAGSYWERSDRFDFALDLTAGRRGHAALAQVISAFLRHMLAIEAEVE